MNSKQSRQRTDANTHSSMKYIHADENTFIHAWDDGWCGRGWQIRSESGHNHFELPPPRPLQTYYLTTIGNLGNGSGTQNKRDRMGMWSGEQEEPSTDRHGDRELTRVKGVATPPPPPLRPFRVPRLDVAARISCYLHCAPRIAAAAAIARLHSTQSLTRCVA